MVASKDSNLVADALLVLLRRRHEIVGKVTRVGSKVTEFKVGASVGVGAQVFSE